MTDDERGLGDEAEGKKKRKDRHVRIVKNDETAQEEARDQASRAVDKIRKESRGRVEETAEDAKETVEDTIQKGVDSVDNNLVDLLSSFLDTETRAKVYLYLRKRGEATSEEIAEDTGLYPSTVRECLSDLYQEGVVERRKKQTQGAGNNPYVYQAVQPSELARRFSERVEKRLNQLFNLDSYLGESHSRRELKSDWSPYKIVIESENETAEGNEEETDKRTK
ncbi:MAG: helix-turn-helix domain-containing protein [Halobacteriales archaeon]|nr:helix-turn-helix domain-containing protein [Halobacteriales archaeon]